MSSSPLSPWPTTLSNSSHFRLTMPYREHLLRPGPAVEAPGRHKPVITDRQQLRTYECDGLAQYRVTPAAVVLPETTGQVAGIVELCTSESVPIVARGSGTGLSGGALPTSDGVLIVTSRMRSILKVDPSDERAVVEPGVANLEITRGCPFRLLLLPGSFEPTGLFHRRECG